LTRSAQTPTPQRVLVVGVPGAFTPVCSKKHVPGYVKLADKLRACGLDAILVVAVNDPFVLQSWGAALHVGDKLGFVADSHGALTRALGMQEDMFGWGMGTRCRRFALLAVDGVVRLLRVETSSVLVDAAAAENMLRLLPAALQQQQQQQQQQQPAAAALAAAAASAGVPPEPAPVHKSAHCGAGAEEICSM
jgi:peroxiredoxin